MTIQTTLPRVNELGYYEMRLESIGGLGANLCGKLLGELGAVQLGLNAASFSSYGSEKRGSPLKAFIRPDAGDPHQFTGPPSRLPGIVSRSDGRQAAGERRRAAALSGCRQHRARGRGHP